MSGKCPNCQRVIEMNAVRWEHYQQDDLMVAWCVCAHCETVIGTLGLG